MQVYLNRINSSADTGLAILRCAWLETLVKGLTLKQVNATVAFAKVTLKMTDRGPDRCSASPALFLSNISRLWSSFGPHRCYGHFRRMFTMTQDKYSYWSHGYRCRWMILPCPNSLFRVSRLASRLGPEFDPKWLVTTTRSDNWSAMSKTRPDQHAYYALSYVCGSMILNELFDFSIKDTGSVHLGSWSDYPISLARPPIYVLIIIGPTSDEAGKSQILPNTMVSSGAQQWPYKV